MLLYLQENSDKPLYIQVYEQVKAKIMQKNLSQGQKLPSKRQLAQDNGISQNTVINAYEQLQVEGYIRSEERRGYFVEDIDFQALPISEATEEKTREKLKDLPTLQPLLDLTRSNPDPSLFPSTVFAKIYNRLMSSQDPRLLESVDKQGLYELRGAIASYLSQTRGVPCSRDQVVLAPNSQFLLDIIFKVLPSIDQIGMEDPGYPGYRSLLALEGIEGRPITVDREGISVQELDRSVVDTVFVTPNHQFPTGSIMPLDRRQQLLAWANAKKGRLIIEDDYDGEFKYSGIPVPPLIQLDHHQKVVYIGSFTRVLAPGIRLSYMVLPEKMIASYRQIFSGFSSSLNSLVQYALYDFIRSEHFTSHLNRSRRFYKKKRDLLIQAIEDLDPQAVVYGEEAGLSMLVRPFLEFDGQRLKDLAKADQVRLSLLSDYKQKPKADDEQTLFLSFSSIPMEDIERVVHRLRDLMQASLV